MYEEETYIHVSGDSPSIRLTTYPDAAAGITVTSHADAYGTGGTAGTLIAAASATYDVVAYGVLVYGLGTDTAGGNVIIYDDTTTVADPQIIVHSMEDDNAFIPIPPVKFEAGHKISVVYASATNATAGTAKVKLFVKELYY